MKSIAKKKKLKRKDKSTILVLKSKAMKNFKIWLCFDLYIDSDYNGLYKWLDARKAISCGENMAYLTFQFNGNIFEDLKKSISESMKVSARDTIYVITANENSNPKHLPYGNFVFGERKIPNWKGFAELQYKSGEDSF